MINKYHCYCCDCADSCLGTCRTCSLNLTALDDNNRLGLVWRLQLFFVSFLPYLLLVPLINNNNYY